MMLTKNILRDEGSVQQLPIKNRLSKKTWKDIWNKFTESMKKQEDKY